MVMWGSDSRGYIHIIIKLELRGELWLEWVNPSRTGVLTSEGGGVICTFMAEWLWLLSVVVGAVSS